MSNSPYQDTVFVLDLLNSLETKSLLDVGAGFGRWGFLCRCHLGTGDSLTAKPRQHLRIEAVEVHAPNINPVYDAVYDEVHRGNILEVLPNLGEYDVIICGHVVEHFEKDDGWALIQEMRAHARMAVVLGVPFNAPLRGPVTDGDHEAHKSVWTAEDFAGTPALVRSFRFLKGVDAGVVVYPISDEAKWLVKNVRSPLRRFFARAVRGLGRETGRD